MPYKFFFLLLLTLQAYAIEPRVLSSANKAQLSECMKNHAPDNEGWIKATFLYGEGMSCFDALVPQTRPDFYSLIALEYLSGLSIDKRAHSTIVQNNNYSWPKQIFINPDFIAWLDESFMIHDKTSLLFKAFSERYKEYQDFVRSFYFAYQFITHNKSFKTEQNAYVNETRKGTDGITYLFNTYKNAVYKKYAHINNPNAIVYGIGFWLRRGIDESKDKMYRLLVKLLQTYDQKWYKSKATEVPIISTQKKPSLKW